MAAAAAAELPTDQPATTSQLENDDEQSDISDGHGSHPNATDSTGQIKCSICQSSFRRPEHLRRHFRRHTKEKPFECSHCGRHFSRTDTLHRHELSYHAVGVEGPNDRNHRITVKTFRACYKCATARVRCSGGVPCTRCEVRSFECQYPTERRSKTKGNQELSEPEVRLSPGRRDSIPRSSPREPSRLYVDQNESESTAEAPREGEQVINQAADGFDHSTIPRPDGSTVGNPTICDHSGKHQTQIVSEMVNMSASEILPGNNDAADVGPILFSPFDGMNVNSMYQSMSTPFAGHIEHFPGGGVSSNMDIGVTNARDQQMQLDQTFPDQSIFTAINWLPTGYFSDATKGRSLPSISSSEQQPGVFLSDSLAQAWWLPPVVNQEHVSPLASEHVTQTPAASTPLRTDLDSPSQCSQGLEGSANSDNGGEGTRLGDYYVDGTGARLPKYRRTGSWSRSSAERSDAQVQLPEHFSSKFSLPLIRDVSTGRLSDEVADRNWQIDMKTYNQMYRHFVRYCRAENFIYTPFESDYFPPADILSRFVYIYFDSFQPVYPILHPSSFHPNQDHWLLVLAIVAIGCHAADIPETAQCTVALHEFLRRAIIVEKERWLSTQVPLWLMQAMLLNSIGLFHCGNERARSAALSGFADLVTLVNREKLLNGFSTQRALSNYGNHEPRWATWIEDELRRRMGYCAWLVDCTFAYQSDNKPFFTLSDAQAALPSRESLWEAKSAEIWSNITEKSPNVRNVSLYTAVQTLFIEKKLVSGIGEFSHVLLIHALYQRMWEVGESYQRPLSFWNPTAKKQSQISVVPTGSVWLPGIPLYSKWRNSACDCLDILHWTANSTIAKAAGLEHPTVLHLHASRLILLTPFREIRCLASALALGKVRWGDHTQTTEWQRVWRWVKHDQYKARLSMIHAGVVLWHVRRYSTNAFHEPVATFLAALALWAYGSCHAAQSHQTRYLGDVGQMQASDAPDEAAREPTFIHLDRPCDDELVQLFVRDGQTMRGNVTGVGDICGPRGPEGVLRVGGEILARLTAWGISRELLAMLTKLSDLMMSS